MQKNRFTSQSKEWTKSSKSLGPRPLHAIDSYTKEDLYLKVQSLMEENHQMKHNQKSKVQELLQLLEHKESAGISTPTFSEENYADKDQFADLVSAAHIIQKDIYDAINKFGQLEQQIEQRTRELAYKEANLSAIIENTPDIIFSVDKFLKILITNSPARALSRQLMQTEMQPGMSLLRALPKELLDEWIPKFRDALKGETSESIFTSDLSGKDKIYQYSLNPIHDADMEIVGVSFFCKDITEQESYRDDKVRQEQLLSSINFSIKEGIFRTSPDKGMVYINKAFVQMFRYNSVEEMMDIDLDDLYVNPARRQDFRNIMIKNTEFVNEEVLFKRKDGTQFRALLSSIKTVDELNGNVYFDGAIRDITELNDTKNQLQKQNKELRHVNEELKKVNEELDSFVYSISHDLRAPLVSVKGLINISRLTDSQEEKERYLGLIETSIDKLDHFITDIIGYSRNTRLEIRHEEIPFETLVRGCFESFAYMDNMPHIKRELEVNLNQPFFSDPTRLEIIFNNIVSNAIRYSDPNKPESYLKISIQDLEEDKIRIVFHDNGIGIKAAYVENIFDIFYRGTHVGHGSGIGLYIVREATLKLQGKVWVESEEGKGSTFYLDLPRLEAPKPLEDEENDVV